MDIEDRINASLQAEEENKATYQLKRLLRHNTAVRDNLISIGAICDALQSSDLTTAFECYHELGQEMQTDLNLAPSKGGVFTTHEKKVLKDNYTKYLRGEL